VLATGAVVLVSINTSLNASLRIGAVAYTLLAVVGPQLFKLEQAFRGQDEPVARSSISSPLLTSGGLAVDPEQGTLDP